ncbi:hypothetical protein PN36_34185 [Candidatus Thiomargarita nelsonii]|uniref:Lipoprotein n=1 Tax=Candidatus Thiomargarita nelsonii TaxID=1003181 RepID=A0A0A6RQV3_9GAMM|nr:hypothetical protein PN36_34185 [Candidatus Thiomargarita nelsonii]
MKILTAVLIILLTACVSNPTKTEPASYLKYINANSFDQRLSVAMEQETPEIEIGILSPFSSNNIPERLDNWLSAINENGGKVKPKPADGERIIESLKIILGNIYQDFTRYAPAKNYSVAELIYRRNESGEAMIEKIILKKR